MRIDGNPYDFDAIEFRFREIRDVFTERIERVAARLIRELELDRLATDEFREQSAAHHAEQRFLRAALRAAELRALLRRARLCSLRAPRQRVRARTCSQASRWMVLQ